MHPLNGPIVQALFSAGERLRELRLKVTTSMYYEGTLRSESRLAIDESRSLLRDVNRREQEWRHKAELRLTRRIHV